MAERTRSIRIGTLVTSMYFRQPVTFAKSATTIDHLSAGRLEIAVGVGDPSAGVGAAGVGWTTAERVARFVEFVEPVQRRGSDASTTSALLPTATRRRSATRSSTFRL
ncbi:MAG TPA: LLM class flavin-dependent oxidoreductase [Jatrophihabitans sp.]|jgi:alkanesulfonate monooxygenase SsuD/methylene tetrahydromethanopterin reductase-like flavin-dependent oxidoreductase (luciferase family)